MQASVVHTPLAPIAEASGGGGLGTRGSVVGREREPRRSLRYTKPPSAVEQPRRYTVQLHAMAPSAPTAVGTAGSERQQRTWRRASSIKSTDSQGGAAGRHPGRLANTYRTEPARFFQLEAAEALVAERLAGMLHGCRYDAHSAPMLSRNLALEIKNKVKQACSANQQRYKLVVLVTITEPSAPSGLLAARALWSAETGDACARAEFRGTHVAASAAVFAFYCE